MERERAQRAAELKAAELEAERELRQLIFQGSAEQYERWKDAQLLQQQQKPPKPEGARVSSWRCAAGVPSHIRRWQFQQALTSPGFGAAPAEGFAAQHKRYSDNLAGADLLSELAAGGGTFGLTGSPQRCCAGGEKKSEGNQIWALWQAVFDRVARALGLLPGPSSRPETHAKDE